jgi:asparagine synthase (glutamine-hydrolysing)
MCGLVGVGAVNPLRNRSWLANASKSIIHRGPDDSGEWWSDDGRVGLAHRRLSILDLSIESHQPMHILGAGLSIVFNGEIYNFKEIKVMLESIGYHFTSSGDTEVLLASYDAWGIEFLSKLNGMFSFALYDARIGKLFLVRDRAGEKPLFYRLQDNKIYFSSELKGLMCCSELPRSINRIALDNYLDIGFVPGDLCILEGYKKLTPAHALSFDINDGKVEIWSYWEAPNVNSPSLADEGMQSALALRLEHLLEGAVGRQLVADVPVGILLSGGLDSSLIAAMAARNSSKVHTFTIGFPGGGRHDETLYARTIAKYFRTEHTELMAGPATAELIPMLARQFDEPIVDSSMIPTYLLSKLVRKSCKVAIGGDGADELFGGYRHYERLLWMKRRLMRCPLILRSGIAKLSQKILPVGIKGRNYLMAMGSDFDMNVPMLATYFDLPTRRKLLPVELWPSSNTIDLNQVLGEVSWDPDFLQRATRADFTQYLPNDILTKVDRTSMLNSLEVRSPYLDKDVIEFAFGSVPSSLKATSSERKILLKCVAKKALPIEFDANRKQGFSIPLSAWLKKGAFRDLFWGVLTNADCIFDRRTVLQLLRNQDRGLDNSERLFALVQFELWRREYKITT